MSDFLTADEVADILRCTRRYVLRLAREGHLERVKPPGRKTVLFPAAGVQAYLDTGRQPAARIGGSAARPMPEVAAFQPRTRTTKRRRFH